MASKPDPKDDRIAELELQLEAATKSIQDAEGKAAGVPALQAQISTLEKDLKASEKRVADLRSELDASKVKNDKSGAPTVKDLDPAKALQLKVSCVLTNSITKQRIDAVAGDVIALQSAFAEMQQKLGTSVKLHPVSKDEFDATKTAGRAH
jgi:predicted RNase H-like nuclease (RuvC/YqgF family)